MPDEAAGNPVRISERIGKYEILGHIATGGMGMVYLARDVDLDRQVALKILPPELAKQPVTLERFKREGKAAARLRHENIVAIFDISEINGLHCIALEYVDGTDLQAYITRKCRLEAKEARNIMLQATRALVHAHAQGIVHRDIKPSNFLLMFQDKRLIVKLTDFGLAIRSESEEEGRITRDRSTIGTVDYISPEQACDSRSADIRSDIYSLGCTFFHMLAGKAPFPRGSMPERLMQHMTAEPPDMRKLNKLVPEYMVAIINRMLAKKPEDRYQTPADLLRDLEHPDRVAVKSKKSASPKLERGKGRRKPGSTTAVLENKGLDEASAEPEQIKVAQEVQAVDPPMELQAEPEVTPAELEQERDTKQEDEITNFGTDAPEDEDEDLDSEDEDDEDEDEDDETPSISKAALQNPLVWIGGAAGAVVFLGLVLIIALALRGRTPPPKKPPEPPIVENVKPPDDKPLDEEPPPKTIDTTPLKMTVPALPLPIMDIEPAKADVAGLRKDYLGPFGPFPEDPKGVLAQVRRLAPSGPASILEAVTATTKAPVAIIEIADNGPIFVASLPAQKERTIVLRGAAGYRPILVWDSDSKSGATLLALSKGKLILENLDIAVRWFDDAPAALFDLADADFHARNCTFSLAGKSAAGIALVRRAAGKDEPRRTQTRLQRCYLRGVDATLLSMTGGAADLLIEESLIVGERQPLIHVRAKDADALALFCVRSTMTTGQVLLRWQGRDTPHLQGRILDSILSRDDPPQAQGDMVQLVDAAELGRMSWQASNSVYAGWKRLLSAGPKSIAGHDLAAWRRQWKSTDGERVLDSDNPWPNSPPSKLEEHSAETFLPAQTPVGFAALTGPGAIGCVIGWLPAAPEGWQERVFKQRDVPVITNPAPNAPTIESAKDGRYHGEKLDLNKVPDLGAHLSGVLEKMTPAPRVVLHLTGKGERETSPLRIKGVQDLVLYFEPSKDTKDPLILVAAPVSLKQRAPLIEMTEGNLEIIGARIRLSNVTSIPTLIQVQAGNLTLSNCWLQGPLVRAPDNFNQLIAVSNYASPPATVLLRNNVLVSGKALLQLTEQVQLRAKNNLFVALADGVHIDCAGPPPAMVHVLEQNTWAARQTFFTMRTAPESMPDGPIMMHVSKNAFLHPFADQQDKATLLRGGDLWCGGGMWRWQGRFNVYDPRLHAYFAGVPAKPVGPKQTLRDWQRAWGPVAEQDAQTLDAGAASRTLNLDGAAPPVVLLQLERLATPGQGADVMGILKKKG